MDRWMMDYYATYDVFKHPKIWEWKVLFFFFSLKHCLITSYDMLRHFKYIIWTTTEQYYILQWPYIVKP